MESLLTTGNITFVLGVLGIIFAVYRYFQDPQQALDKRQAVDQTEMDGKAAILAQQFQWEKDANEKKFNEFAARLDSAMTLAQNHIHTVDTKVNSLVGAVGALSNDITRLTTIIDERIPKK